MTKLSIIVPIYNVEQYLEKCLKSLKQQSYQDFKVLMINDGSLDNCQQIIERYEKIDYRFKGYSKENGGLSSARNYGLQYVDTEYVMFIDSDDFCETNMVKECLNNMEQNHLDIFVFAYNQYCQANNHKETIDLGIKDGIYNLKNDPSILAYTPNAVWNKIYKTSLFNEIKYPLGYRHQDLGTTAKLLFLSERIGYSNKPLYNYLADRPNNITSKVDDKIYHIIDMAQEILEYYKNNLIFDQYYDELNYLCELNIIQSLRKVMNNTNSKFVNKFIDDVFIFKKKYFKRKNNKYQFNEKHDYIYMNKLLLKLYYFKKCYLR